MICQHCGQNIAEGRRHRRLVLGRCQVIDVVGSNSHVSALVAAMLVLVVEQLGPEPSQERLDVLRLAAEREFRLAVAEMVGE